MSKLSVILPVHKIHVYFEEAVESVSRDLPADSEILVIGNGMLIQEFQQVREICLKFKGVRAIYSPDSGLAEALNFGLSNANGEFIARMDSDDISLPGRFQAQIDYLSKHSNIAAVGTNAKQICPHGKVSRSYFYPRVIRKSKNKPTFPKISHPTAMIRMSALDLVGRYSVLYPAAEDHELWTRLLDHFDLGNLRRKFLLYRVHANQESTIRRSKQLNSSLLISLRDLIGEKRISDNDLVAAVSKSDLLKLISKFNLDSETFKLCNRHINNYWMFHEAENFSRTRSGILKYIFGNLPALTSFFAHNIRNACSIVVALCKPKCLECQ